MNRIVILGRGGAGKSTLAAHLGAALALPVIELDKHFWAPGLTPTPTEQWIRIQHQLISGKQWVIDGDLGPYDVLTARLQAADTVIVLDFPLWLCAWRALRRSRENLAFWRWLITYRRHSLPTVMAAIATHAGHAQLHVLHHPRAAERLLSHATTTTRPDPAP
ncbi:topology modulation protein [Catenuloplanes atrovinosus]|uniref:Adenylate kinase family enzyme n=1 Tax=Catenuloplanes atrovinosus TaxID=137266 RepID=A0AAE3YKV8_9ACTN|nr:topology modulation protein [Catenuloplanes atrovinosus]MDR7275674.1 adenylate kinase family enzyme [Catenuloplanes atrovinosus]